MISFLVRGMALILFPNSFSTDLEWSQWVGDLIVDKAPHYTSSAFPFFPYLGALSIVSAQWMDQFLFMKIMVSLADIAVTYVVARIGGTTAGFMYAVNPITVITLTIHGQFDSFPALFLLLAVAALGKRAEAISMLLFSTAIFTKNWVIFATLSLWRRLKNKWLIFLIPLVPVVTTLFHLWYFHVPFSEMLSAIKDYRGVYGVWGLGAVVDLVWPGLDPSIIAIVRKITLGTFLFLMFFIRRKNIFEEILFTILALYLLTPTFGSQWLAWSIPFLCLVRPKGWRVYITASLVFVLISFWGDVYPYPQGMYPQVLRYVQYASFFAWGAILRLVYFSYRT